jgi:hypothetical protein
LSGEPEEERFKSRQRRLKGSLAQELLCPSVPLIGEMFLKIGGLLAVERLEVTKARINLEAVQRLCSGIDRVLAIALRFLQMVEIESLDSFPHCQGCSFSSHSLGPEVTIHGAVSCTL